MKESILFQIWYRLMRNNHIHECMIYRKNKNTSLQTASQVPTVTNNQHSKTAMPTTKKVGCTQLPTTYKLLIFIKTPTQSKGLSRRPL